MYQYGFWKTSLCPLCLRSNETTTHCFCCQDARAIDRRTKAFRTLEKGLVKIYSAKNIQQCILALVHFALDDIPVEMATMQREDLRRLMGHQLSLDPQALMHGRICLGWASAQSLAYQNYSPWRSGEYWAATTVALLWDFTFSLWTLRNLVLHDKPENHPDITPETIDYQILKEWTIGPDPAWDNGGRSLFKGITCEQLLAKPLPQRRQWLQYVNLARDSLSADDISL
jgi:hypothetical protein